MLLAEFRRDWAGKKYPAELFADERFYEICKFLDNKDRQKRMVDSERWHDRPALAGVVVELEERFFVGYAAEPSLKLKQAIGVLTRIIMVNHQGWRPSGKRAAVGVGRYFKRSERYRLLPADDFAEPVFE